MHVVFVRYRPVFIMRVVMVVIVGVTVGQIPMAVFVVVMNFLDRGLASQTSASLAHLSLLAPACRRRT